MKPNIHDVQKIIAGVAPVLFGFDNAPYLLIEDEIVSHNAHNHEYENHGRIEFLEGPPPGFDIYDHRHNELVMSIQFFDHE